ncbi:MAG: Na+/H+ antiporter NhaC family protein [Sulfurimonas sp.]|nr:Na+/H+ antiporter NhaC family protein [Sulfurimonadaceae bacterium]
MQTFLSLLPSFIILFLALRTKNVFLALGSGIFLAYFILNSFHPLDTFLALFELFYNLLSTSWVLKTLSFALMAGSIIALVQSSGGVYGFVEFMLKNSLIKTQRSSLMLSFIVGIVIFIESSITSLIAGAVGKPFCHKYKIPSEKLAFVCDSTSAPISSLIAINGWGALLLGLIGTQMGVMDSSTTKLLLNSLLLNFYSIIIIVIVFLFIYFDINIGPMRECLYKPKMSEEVDVKKSSAIYMVIPMFLMVVFVFIFMYITGDGEILQGSGSSSIFYTMLCTLAVMFLLYIPNGILSSKEWGRVALNGAKDFVPITLILLLAFAIGEGVVELKTGEHLASLLSGNLPVWSLAGFVFIISAIISFSTGTSWGTFSIMIPIAFPIAIALDANLALVIGAVISGGVFGDHCSPISDTTIISSMASDCEVISHVKTQLPYALIGAFIALSLFFITGYMSKN